MNIDNCNFFNDFKRSPEFSSLGVCLRQARESIGLTQKNVAKSLCLRLSVIRGIEDGCLDHLEISSIFLCGYIRSYARLVGLDSEIMIMPVIDELKSESSVKDETKFKTLHLWNKFKGKFRLVILSVVFFICIALILYAICYLKWFSPDRRNHNITYLSPVNFLVVGYDKNDLTFFPKKNFLKVKSNVFLSCPFFCYMDYMIPSFCSIFDFSKKFNQILNSADYYSVNYYSANCIYRNIIWDFFYDFNILNNICDVSDDYMLVMNFTSDCWVEILDFSGKKLYVGTQYSGNVLNLKGQIPYKLTIGAPQSVQIKYRGSVVSLKKFIDPYKVAHITIPD